MKIAFINQTFYPDVVSSGQHLADLASRMADMGHEVTVITSRRAYDDPQKTFPRHEVWNKICIYRLFNTSFGKAAKWKRAVDFASFLISACWKLLWLPKQDVIMALTSPPIVSFIASAIAKLRGIKFCYWIMDLNPDEALAAGWLRPNSLITRSLEWCSRFSLRYASKIVVLDSFMRDRIVSKGIDQSKIEVIPPWSHDSDINFDKEARERFRKAQGLENKFVVMYSGNHSPCHPLDTVLGAAKLSTSQEDIAFCFVGGGSEFKRLKKESELLGLKNVAFLPYQPLNQLSGSLSAADLHLVVMGNPFVGLVHPCKIYNIMLIGAPLLYIGPSPSHISQILESNQGELQASSAKHGDVELVVKIIQEMKERTFLQNRIRPEALCEQFSMNSLLNPLIASLESLVISRDSIKQSLPQC